MVLAAPKAVPRKGYILTAPDLVPMAMMRSSGSKARALGWLGKPCSTVCGGRGGHLHRHSCPWPTPGSLQALLLLCTRTPAGSPCSVCSLTVKGAIMPPWVRKGLSQAPSLGTCVHPLWAGLQRQAGSTRLRSGPTCPRGSALIPRGSD